MRNSYIVSRTMLSVVLLTLLSSVFVTHAQDQPRTDLPPEFPEIRVTVSNNPASGVLYLANVRRTGSDADLTQPFLMILNNDGTPAYFQRAPMPPVYNFGLMPNGNRYVYSMTDGGLGRGASMDGVYHILNPEGDIIRDVTVVGDFPTQMHDFVPLENGNIILLSQPWHIEDLTRFGGSPEAIVVENVIQEIDRNRNVVFEWWSSDHVELTDTRTDQELRLEPPEPVGYMHINALAVDNDGNLIISARRFDELIKIDRQTGDIIWRIGGPQSRNNQFTFIDDPRNGFSGQHSVSVLPNGNILLFDNADFYEDRVSRVVEYAIDEENLTATLVWSYIDPLGRYTGSMGSAQRLTNGNTLISWGSASPDGPTVTEVTLEGEIALELWLPPTQMVYRVYRYDE